MMGKLAVHSTVELIRWGIDEEVLDGEADDIDRHKEDASGTRMNGRKSIGVTHVSGTYRAS